MCALKVAHPNQAASWAYLRAPTAAARLLSSIRVTVERLHRLGLVGRLTLIGVAFGATVTGLAVQLLDARVDQLLASQAEARARDQVQLAIEGRVNASDFASPHTSARLAELHARLAPSLGRVRADGAGVLGISLVARDGTVLYADLPAREGQAVPAAAQPLLAMALTGRLGTGRETVLAAGDGDPSPPFDSAVAVYVPVVVDGSIVGVYALDQAPAPVGPFGPLACALGGGMLGVLFHLAARTVATPQARPSAWLGAPVDVVTGPKSRPTPRPALGLEQALTRREREVLRLLATSVTYQEIAVRLVVSEETVRSHVKHILHKLGQPSRTLAVVAALQAGLVEPP